MRKPVRWQVPLESLDARLAPSSALAAMPAAEVSALARQSFEGQSRLKGVISGHFQSNGASAADAPDKYTLSHASGSIQYKDSHLGLTRSTHLKGAVYGTGFSFKGHSVGSIVLRSAAGKVTLDLTGPEQAGFQPPASQFHYVIRKGSGTGSLADASGSGTVKLELLTTSKPDSLASGRFTFRFV